MVTNNTKDERLPFGDEFWRSLNSKTIIYDLIYNPKETALLNYCRKKGCYTINGIKMLVAQGAKSLSYWTDGLEIPLKIMEEAIQKHL